MLKLNVILWTTNTMICLKYIPTYLTTFKSESKWDNGTVNIDIGDLNDFALVAMSYSHSPALMCMQWSVEWIPAED